MRYEGGAAVGPVVVLISTAMMYARAGFDIASIANQTIYV